jgi:hypothetical protein
LYCFHFSGKSSNCAAAVQYMNSGKDSIPAGNGSVIISINTGSKINANAYTANAAIKQFTFDSNSTTGLSSAPSAFNIPLPGLNLNNTKSLEAGLQGHQGTVQSKLQEQLLGFSLGNDTDAAKCANATWAMALVIPSTNDTSLSLPGVSNGCAGASGFIRGNYGGIYFRVVDEKGTVVGGTKENPDLFSTKGLDQGVNGTRVVGSVMGSGPLFCRGVGVVKDASKASMACVLFDETGKVLSDKYGLGSIGTWNDFSVVQGLIAKNALSAGSNNSTTAATSSGKQCSLV